MSTSNARPLYVYSWYDGAGRQTHVADYGTNGGSEPTRPSTAPSSSDTILVAQTNYDAATGQAYETILRIREKIN